MGVLLFISFLSFSPAPDVFFRRKEEGEKKKAGAEMVAQKLPSPAVLLFFC